MAKYKLNVMIYRLNHSELKLVVNVRSHQSLPVGGANTYKRRESLTATVDRHNYGQLQFIDFIGERFLWCLKQYISFWLSSEDASIEIKRDKQLLQLN